MDFNGIDYANGDCFAIGVPRTADQAFAVRNLGIDASIVRSLASKITTIQGRKDYKDGNSEIVEDEITDEAGATVDLADEITDEAGEAQEGPALDVLVAFLKENKVQGAHKMSYETALKKAIELGFAI